jgi:hypothetical protein
MRNRDVWLDLNEQLAELGHQINRRADWLTEGDLRAAWNRHLDSVLAVRAEEQAADRIEPPSEAETAALQLIWGLLIEDHQVSVDAMHDVLIELDGDDVLAVVLVLLQILMCQIGVDRHDREFDHVGVGEPDYADLAELDGDGVVDVLLVVLKILRHVIGDHDEVWRSRIRTRLGGDR